MFGRFAISRIPTSLARHVKSARSSSTSAEGGFLNADNSKSVTKFHHTSGYVLVGLTPLAFMLSPSWINFPIDLTLGVMFPVHSQIALNYVITDYVPKAARTMARSVLLGSTVIAAAGLLKLNLMGPGLTETIKSLWRSPKKKVIAPAAVKH